MKNIFVLIVVGLFFLSCTKVEEKQVTDEKKVEVKKPTEKVEKNAAQAYVDAQKKNMDNAKASVEKNQKAQDDQKKEIDNLLGK